MTEYEKFLQELETFIPMRFYFGQELILPVWQAA